MNPNRIIYSTAINEEIVPAILQEEPEVVEVAAHGKSGAGAGGEAQYTYTYITNEDYGTETAMVTLTAHELVIDENGHPITLEQLVENSTVEEVETLEQGDGTHTILRIVPNSMHDDQHEEDVEDKEVNDVKDEEVDAEELVQKKDEMVAVKHEVECENDDVEFLFLEETVDHSAEQKIRAGDARKKTFHCPNCSNRYNSVGSLKIHYRACLRQRNEAPTENRQCKVCSKVFSTVGYLKKHMLRHTGVQIHKCFRCYSKFVEESKFAAHMESHKHQDKLEAEAAAFRAKHGGKKVIVKEFKCSFCFQNFSVVFDVGQVRRRYACDSCRDKHSKEEEMRQNKQQEEKKPGFSCERCGRQFVFQGFLQRHFPKCDGTIKHRRGMK
ncbi:hypothetical protein KR026_008868 [Drosophila bipectinata]|nr:hypothetical protein KR026_008868 [Drosophila bipectinata]